jgi:type I restriction enzyme S subunit
MSDWPLRKISDVAEFLNHKRIPVSSLARQKRQGPYPYYGASGIVDHIDDYIFDGTYLLISEDGENLRTRNTPIAFKASGKFWVNNHAHILAEKEEGILDYFEYFFSKLDLTPYITGAVQPNLNKANLDRIEIPVPDKEERLVINKVLNSLSNKIELNRQINQTLEHIAQAIFKSWFIDFEPAKAKIAANQALTPTLSQRERELIVERAAMCAISGKTEEELDQFSPEQYQQLFATAALFSDELEDSELGEIPKGWKWSIIGDEVEVVGGGTPSTKNQEFWEGGQTHWTSPKDLSGLQDKILVKTEKKITEAGLEKISSGLLPIDTILMSSRAPVGYLALAKIPVAINQGYIAMKCLKRLPPEFVLLWTDSVMDEIKRRASGSTFAEISKKNFRPIAVVVPNSSVVAAFQKQVKPLFDKITESVLETESLTKIRDSLLPKLLSGEILIGDIDSSVKATA